MSMYEYAWVGIQEYICEVVLPLGSSFWFLAPAVGEFIEAHVFPAVALNSSSIFLGGRQHSSSFLFLCRKSNRENPKMKTSILITSSNQLHQSMPILLPLLTLVHLNTVLMKNLMTRYVVVVHW